MAPQELDVRGDLSAPGRRRLPLPLPPEAENLLHAEVGGRHLGTGNRRRFPRLRALPARRGAALRMRSPAAAASIL